MAWQSGKSITADNGPSIDKMMLLAAGCGVMIVVAGISVGYWTAGHDRQGRSAERIPACTAAAQRLLAADTLIALEREKYLLTAMECDVWRQVRDLRN